MKQEKRKIIIIEPNPNSTGGFALLKSAKRMELEVHVVTHENIYQEHYSDKMKKLIDCTFFTNFCMEQQAVDEIANYGRKINVDGVVAGSEFTADMAVKVCAKLKLPSHEVTKCAALRRKDLMHEHFYENKVSCAKTIIIRTWEECLDAAKEIGYPLVIKPSSNAGSLSVFGVKDQRELKCAYENINETNIEFPHGMRLDDHILVQEYLIGQEFSVEVAVINGEVNILAITDKLTTTGSYFAETGHTLPTKLNLCEQKAIIDMAKCAVVSLGIKNGIGHVEVKLTSEGAKIIEVGARMPGDKIADLLLLAYGIDEGRIYLQISMGLAPDLTPKATQYAAIRFIICEREGIINRIDCIEDIKIVDEQSEGVVEIDIYTQPGAKIGIPKNNMDRVGHIIAVSSKYNDACKIASEALDIIKVNLIH